MNFIHHSTQLQPDLNQQGEDESIRTFALEHTTQSIRSAHIISSQHNAEHNLQLFPTSNSALKFESEKLPSSSSPSTKIQLSFPSTSSPSLDPIASRPTPEITTVIQSNSQTPSNKSSTAVSKSRTRPITKCDRCRTRKCACDSHHPCSTCRTSGANCIYTEGKPIFSANGNSPLAISTKARKKRMITNSSSLKNERRRLDEKFGKLQLLLQDAAISASLQSHPSGSASSLALIEVDLEVDNLVTHFSKLWLREEPDLSFFRSSHPTLVRVRQYDLPRWRLSQTWATWSDHPAAGPEQQVTRFDRSFLPLRAECRSHCKRFFMHCDWYFELLTQSEINAAAEEVYHFNELDINPETPAQWTRIALALAICRLSLACLDWITTAETERISRKRGEKILRWCDLSVLALKCAGFDQNPTVDGIRVLVILLSTIFFETDYGLMGCSPPMLRLRRVAMDVAYRLNLNRDPERNFSSKEKDDRRRMWWSLVVIDSHFYATGASTDGVIRLQASDVRLPEFRQVNSTERGGYEAFQPLDLRSARTRFELGRLNNRCCQLFSQKRPLATMADIWSLDKEIVELEKRVPVDQRLSVDGKRVLSPQNLPVHNQIKVDEALWNGQQIFYIAIWHIRSKIHRGLLYTNQTSEAAQRGINLPMHRDIVKNGSLLLLDLYSHTKLPTAFVSAIASATLTLTLELIERPSDDDNLEIQKKVLECYSRLKTNPSPIITRACQVLDYFLMAIPSRLGTVLPNGLRGLAGWRQMSEKDVPGIEFSGEEASSEFNNEGSSKFNSPEDKNHEFPITASSRDRTIAGSFEMREDREIGLTSSSPGISSLNSVDSFGIGRDMSIDLTSIFPQLTQEELLQSLGEFSSVNYYPSNQNPSATIENYSDSGKHPGDGNLFTMQDEGGFIEFESLFASKNSYGLGSPGSNKYLNSTPTSSLSYSSNMTNSTTPAASPSIFLDNGSFQNKLNNWDLPREQHGSIPELLFPNGLASYHSNLDAALSAGQSISSHPNSKNHV